MTDEFADDVAAILEEAGGSMAAPTLYDALARRGHTSKRSFPTRIAALSGINRRGANGPWILEAPPQGSGESRDVVGMLQGTVSSSPRPPVGGQARRLPFQELSWEDFEYFCVRYANLAYDVEIVMEYGRRGQNQEGIDVLAIQEDDEYTAIQCKRYQGGFSASDLRAAVERFRNGKWFERAGTFTLAVTQRLADDKKLVDAFVDERERLAKEGKGLVIWDTDALSDGLKSQHDVVCDFFGPAWVEEFCAPDTRTRLLILNATSALSRAKSDRSKRLREAAVSALGHRPAEERDLELEDLEPSDSPQKWTEAHNELSASVRAFQKFAAQEDITSIAVFPLARQSLLFALGVALGDQQDVQLFRWDRDEGNWLWRTSDEDDIDDNLQILSPDMADVRHVAVLVSTSMRIRANDALRAIESEFGKEEIAVWQLTSGDNRLKLNALHHPEQLRRFRRAYRELWTKIAAAHGDDIDMHLFMAGPAPFAVAMGQSHLTTARPRNIHLYEYERGSNHRVLTV